MKFIPLMFQILFLSLHSCKKKRRTAQPVKFQTCYSQSLEREFKVLFPLFFSLFKSCQIMENTTGQFIELVVIKKYAVIFKMVI